MAGWSIDSELVIAARKSMKNQIAAITLPSGISAKTTGNVWKPSPKVPDCAAAIAPVAPRKTKAAGIVIIPPKPTSKSSLVDEAVRPERTTSSLRLQYDA